MNLVSIFNYFNYEMFKIQFSADDIYYNKSLQLLRKMLYILVSGANSSLTAAVVVATGLIGANFVQVTLDKLKFRDPIARGIATASRYVLWQ